MTVFGLAQVEAESVGRQAAIQTAEDLSQEVEAMGRVALHLKEDLHEATEAVQHLQSELAAVQVISSLCVQFGGGGET